MTTRAVTTSTRRAHTDGAMTSEEVGSPPDAAAQSTAPSSTDEIKRAAAKGTIALAGRQAVTLVATLLTGVFLARLLSPAQFGALALLLFVVNLGKVLVDLGLSASLVQSREEPSDREKSAVFFVEIVVAVALTAIVVAGAGLLTGVSNAAPGATLSLQLAALSFLTTPITSFVGFVLERRLDFGRQGLLLALQPISFAISSVLLAWMGVGVLALGIGLTFSNLVTMLAALSMRQRIPLPVPHRGAAMQHIRFGVPYMGVNVVSSVKDSVVPLLIGAVAGGAAVGYVSWAQQVATVGAYALFVLSRLLFPVFARLRGEPTQLGAAVTRILFAANLVVAPISAAIAVFAPDITTLLYGEKWLIAVPLLYLLMIGNLVAPTSTVLLALMSALGRPRISLLFASIWLVSTWVFVSTLVPLLGFMGYGWANIGVQLISLALIVVAKRHLRFRYAYALVVPWGVAAAAFAVPAVIDHLVVRQPSFISLIALGLLGCALFSGLVLIVARSQTSYVLRLFLRRNAR